MSSAEEQVLRAQLHDYLRWLERSGREQYVPVVELAAPVRAAASLTPKAALQDLSKIQVKSTASAAGAVAARSPGKSLSAQAKDWSAEQKLNYLQHKVLGNCQRCPLARHRKHVVFGEGDPKARVMVIGEAPGAQEDRAGRPFVGAAGRRLDRWIERSGWSRAELYIANVLKCRPPQNRDPEPREIDACRGFLQAQIRAIAPVAIVALGRFAGALVLGAPGLRLYQMRGKTHFYSDPKMPGVEIQVVVTYHPSFILRKEKELAPGQSTSQEESKVHQDFDRARALVNASAPNS